MGCVVSSDGDDDRRRIIGVSHHHIVSLTSSTYGILTAPPAADIKSSYSAADIKSSYSIQSSPPPPPPPPEEPSPPEVINSWELMSGLVDPATPPNKSSLESDAVVLYTTSLRGVRATYEACNAVRAALQAHGVAFRERDVSMDRGFREELRNLLADELVVPPRLFVRGRHVEVEEVLRLEEEGALAPLLEGLPKARGGSYSCDGCGGMRFLPCFDCSGSRKLLVIPPSSKDHGCRRMVVRCRECNENGLVLCPICS